MHLNTNQILFHAVSLSLKPRRTRPHMHSSPLDSVGVGYVLPALVCVCVCVSVHDHDN